jgi:hypothetical protein
MTIIIIDNGYPNWPDYIVDPPPLNETYKATLPDLVERTDFEQGLARQQQIYASGPTTFMMAWPMTPAQYRLFLGWKFNALKGDGWFNLPVFDTDDAHSRVIRFVKGPIEVGREGGEWMFAAQVETMENIWPDAVETASGMLTWNSDLSLEEVVDLFHANVAALTADMATLFPWLYL